MEQPYSLRTKKITTARKIPTEQQVRDTFHTPRYATSLLIPYIPTKFVWECAAGAGDITRRLEEAGKVVYSTDLVPDESENIKQLNFLTEEIPDLVLSWKQNDGNFSIITNPPFSVKDLFIERCMYYSVPFALLINADYSQWQIDLIKRGCEKLVPTRRISYITPNILKRIHEGEVWLQFERDTENMVYDSMQQLKRESPTYWESILGNYSGIANYTTIAEAPSKLLKKYSSSQFHSMWLTYGFNLGRTETFVDLPLSEMEDF